MIQRWWQTFCLHSTPNTWVSKLDELLTVKNFPCLGELEVKDDVMDEIRITIEIIKKNATVRKLGPIYKGKYFCGKKTD